MEQHNIDSRFKQGLENLNRQPSADAWARLQSKLNEPVAAPEPEAAQPEKKEERRILMWWHYAAAAVVLLFISFGILKNGSYFGGKTAPELAVNQAKEKPAETSEQTEIPAPVNQTEIAPEKAIAKVETSKSRTTKTSENGINKGSKTASIISSEIQLKPETENALAVARPKKKRAVIVDPEKLPVANSKTVQPEKTMLAATNPVTEPKAEIAENKKTALAGMVIEVIVKKDNQESALAMQTPAPEEKDSKLKSIFKQALNLKNGEKVDLQALGVAPDSKLALGTRSLHQKVSKVLDI